jgi:flavodoxin I
MKNIAIVYWSGTGNTEAMAKEIANGAKEAGVEAVVLRASEFSNDMVSNYDKLAFGCPSMGMEQLEESEFEPMFSSMEGSLTGAEVALFGSYGWGSGEWMQSWQERCTAAGIKVFGGKGLIINGSLDKTGIELLWNLEKH